jgi:uncharacterized membrane protein YhhN
MYLTLWSCAFLLAVAYGFHYTFQPPSLWRSLVKTTATLLLALLSFAFSGPHFLTFALLLGACGDAFLSLKKSQGFLPGLVAFLLGHLCFVGLFLQTGTGLEIYSTEVWPTIVVAILVSVSVLLSIKLHPRLGGMKIPVYCYQLVILAMGFSVLMLPSSWPICLGIVGALMFIASDCILSFELFIFNEDQPSKRLTSPLLWCLYWGGQALITLAFLL